jgi:hypothetical protein
MVITVANTGVGVGTSVGFAVALGRLAVASGEIALEVAGDGLGDGAGLLSTVVGAVADNGLPVATSARAGDAAESAGDNVQTPSTTNPMTPIPSPIAALPTRMSAVIAVLFIGRLPRQGQGPPRYGRRLIHEPVGVSSGVLHST